MTEDEIEGFATAGGSSLRPVGASARVGAAIRATGSAKLSAVQARGEAFADWSDEDLLLIGAMVLDDAHTNNRGRNGR